MSRAHTGTINHYHCDACDVSWQDEHCCACDDECPMCGVSISPEDSVRMAACEHPDCADDARAGRMERRR